MPSVENEFNVYYILLSMSREELERLAEEMKFKMKLADDFNLMDFD